MKVSDDADKQLIENLSKSLATGQRVEDLGRSRSGRRQIWMWLSQKALTKKTTWRNKTEVVEIQARWDRRRMERNTAPAVGISRRQGRL